jgi:hypothetical protein
VTGDDVIGAVLDALQAVRIPFMIVGSLATNFHGVPRSTRDADFVVQLPPGAFDAFRRQLGPPLRLDPQSRFEGITGTTRHLVEAAGTAFTVELFELTDDPHDLARFERRLGVRVFDRAAYVATAEDTIITKLRWARQGGQGRVKDVVDARNVIAVQGDSLDWAYVENWCRQHGTLDALHDVRRSVQS